MARRRTALTNDLSKLPIWGLLSQLEWVQLTYLGGGGEISIKAIVCFCTQPWPFWIMVVDKKKGDFAKWVSVMVQVCASTAPVWIMQQTQCSGWWGHWMIEAECGIVWKCVEKCGKVWNSAANVDIGRHSVRLFIKWLTTTSNVWQTYHWPHNLANVLKSFLSFPTWILCVQCWLYNVLCLEASHVVSQLWMKMLKCTNHRCKGRAAVRGDAKAKDKF